VCTFPGALILQETRLFSGSIKICLSVLLVYTALLLTGCGGKSSSGSSTPTPSQAAAITVQPVSQTVPISEIATFTVTATGTAPLSYQWSENGSEVVGATSASYTTTAVTLGEGGSTSVGSYRVTVSNSLSSVTSSTATLTAGPRSPKAGDLRYLLFQQVNLPGLLQNGGLQSGVSAGGQDASTSITVENAVGSPLGIGSTYVCGPAGYECAWPFSAEYLPHGMIGLNMYYKGGEYSNFASDMQSIVAPNVVLTSLDLEPANSAYAASWVQTAQPGGFDYRLEIVPQSQIQAQATLDGTESRVITAASFDQSGNANLISYGWQGDTTTAYETQTVVAAPANVANQATILAGQGYFISAFGGNDTNGYMLIGTRVQGDSLPRPITVYTAIDGVGTTVPALNPDSAYFTPVVFLYGVGSLTAVNEQ
jgi:hypothetical protein